MIIFAKLKTIIISILIITLTVGGTFFINNQKIRAEETTKISPSIGYTVVLDAGMVALMPSRDGQIF